VGYEEGGQLTEAVRRQPYSVILLDEVEKAHPDVFNILLQVLDDGRLSDSQGRTVSFRNTIIVMTSNIGSHIYGEALRDPENGKVVTPDDIMPEIRKFFRIEFVNRIDEIITFQPLRKGQLAAIAHLRFADLGGRLKERGIEAEITDVAAQAIADQSYDPQYGARPINRFLQARLENPLSRMIIAGDLVAGMRLTVDWKDGDFVFATSGEPGKGADGDRGGPLDSARGKPKSGKGGKAEPGDRDVEDAVFEEV
jgi:ATP-dependent Clp protease ATP-binding subunit ClpB